MNETLNMGIIPLAGNASRLKNIPKYLLPCKNNTTLMDNTIDLFEKNKINNIYCGVSNINNILLENNNKIEKIIVKTKTMTETVKNIVDNISEKYNNQFNSILIMPDTYFIINNELELMKEYLNTYKIVVIIWKIKDYQIGKVGQCRINEEYILDVIDKDITCNYEYFWGVIGWNSELNKYINKEWDTIGELIKFCIRENIIVKYIICDSNYYDCGTFDEYFKMIKNELI